MNDERKQLKPYVHVSTRLSSQDRRDAQLLVPILPGTKIKQWRRTAEAALIENNQQSETQNQA
jgi:large subunit ribosomal protein L41